MAMRNTYFKRLIWTLIVIFIAMNLIAFIHAYKFTHFTNDSGNRTKDPKELSGWSKVNILLSGVENPKPKHTSKPSQGYETITVKSNSKNIKCWSIKAPNAKGTVILFHGYSGEKSSLIGRSNQFLSWGYSTLLVDFLGSGDSDGYTTTVGFKEAEQVKACFDYVKAEDEKTIYLFGTSMGAVSILKAINDYQIAPKGIIIECPFGSLYKTVCARFDLMRAPHFPMAGLLTFWGGVQNGYWAFSHNPSVYAEKVSCPTLLMFGAKDDRVSLEEIESIYSNLKGYKKLKIYPHEGHHIFTKASEKLWSADALDFLNTTSNSHP